jgi:KDO2-lipid IV(A) lauroyltransferase
MTTTVPSNDGTGDPAGPASSGSGDPAGPRDPRRRRRRTDVSPDEALEDRQKRRAEERHARRRRREPWLRLGRGLIRYLPLPVACLLGDALGSCVYWFGGWVRRQTLANLAIAFGTTHDERARKRIARRVFANAGRGLFAWIVSHRMGPERALAQCEVVCPEEVRAAISGGAICLSQHYGMFELAGVHGARAFAMRPVGRDGRDGDPTSMLIAMRREMGGETIEQGNPRELVRVLKARGVVGMLIDQDIRGVNGIFVPFFGKPAHTPIGPATFAVRMDVPLVLFRIEWTGLTRHRITYGPVLHARKDLPADAAVRDLTARATAAGEEAIRLRPDHWLWMHERWRTEPGPEDDVSGAAPPAAGGAS